MRSILRRGSLMHRIPELAELNPSNGAFIIPRNYRGALELRNKQQPFHFSI